MEVMKAFYKDNQRRCPSCINTIYVGDCDIVATVDAEISPSLVPRGVPSQPVLNRKTVLVVKNTKLKRAPSGSLQQARARMELEPLTGDLYTLTQACRICPMCGYALPANFDRAKSLTVAVVGDVSSGKSLYISALIKQIQSGKLMSINQQLSFVCVTEDIEEKYIKEYFEPLFKSSQKLLPSQAATETTHQPLIYELTIRAAKDRPSKTLNLIIYDTAGEDYMIRERIVQYTRYVLNADAIIFLADPLAMDSFRDRLPKVNAGKIPTNSATQSLDKIISQVRRFRGDIGFHSVPIAITLSKADLLKYLAPIRSQYSFMQPHAYKGGINLTDLEKVDREVKTLIADYGDVTLLQRAAAFKKVHFFATSATGSSPDASGNFASVQPTRCLDPLLWVLYELKILPAIR